VLSARKKPYHLIAWHAGPLAINRETTRGATNQLCKRTAKNTPQEIHQPSSSLERGKNNREWFIL
jgi:hypothetical protein